MASTKETIQGIAGLILMLCIGGCLVKVCTSDKPNIEENGSSIESDKPATAEERFAEYKKDGFHSKSDSIVKWELSVRDAIADSIRYHSIGWLDVKPVMMATRARIRNHLNSKPSVMVVDYPISWGFSLTKYDKERSVIFSEDDIVVRYKIKFPVKCSYAGVEKEVIVIARVDNNLSKGTYELRDFSIID